MIREFTDRFVAAKDETLADIKANEPSDYDDLVKRMVRIVRGSDYYAAPDPSCIHVVDGGDYQGTRLFVIAEGGYQPSRYWAVKVSYGSCSGCDTFESIREYRWNGEPMPDSEAEGYWTLMLHMAQSMQEV